MESSVKEGGQAECGAGVLGKQGIAAQDMGSGLKQHTSLCVMHSASGPPSNPCDAAVPPI